MKSYSDYKEIILSELSDSYNNLKFDCHIVNNSVPITVFFIIGLSENIEKESNWKKISEDIALKYQSKIKDVAGKWNIYIIYVSTDQMNKELKKNIENNKFSSRKIVENNFEQNFSKEVMEGLIIKHITNEDLNSLIDISASVENIADINEKYSPVNLKLWRKIPNDNIKGDPGTQKIILDEIEKTYDNEN